jgi:enoyl-CoA hydratase/carnithine racemase
MSDVVHVEARDGVGWIALNRPEKLNAINEPMLRGLLAAIAQIGGDPAIGAAVLHGRGRAFSAGGDITAMSGMDEAEFSRTIDLYMQVAAAFRGCPKPIVAAVHGHALAGGFELALICDLRIAADDAVFGLPDAPLGLSPTSGMTYLLPRVIGLGPALELALCAENIGAERAATLGLVSRVVSAATLLAAAGDLAKRMATWPRVGLAMTKSGFYGALDGSFEEATAAEHAAELRCFVDPGVAANLQRFATRKQQP